MEKTLDQVGKLDHSKYDCFFSFVLSHGEAGCVLGSDGNKLALRSVLSPFRKKNCPSLENKPKVFCIQACQGKDVVNGGLEMNNTEICTKLTCLFFPRWSVHRWCQKLYNHWRGWLFVSHVHLAWICFSQKSQLRHLVHTNSCKSCKKISQRVSFRKSFSCEAWNNSLIYRLDFLRMLTIITKEVNEKNGRTSSGRLRQVPIPMSTLTQDLYLTGN